MKEKQCTKCEQVKPISDYYKWTGACKACRRIKNQKYYAANKEKLEAYQAQYRADNKERTKKHNAEYRKNNKQKALDYSAEWESKNRDRINEQKRERREDPVNQLKDRARNRIRHVLGEAKDKSTPEYLGCTYEELKNHLELQFTNHMCWGNMSEWHVDHIVPLASADTLEDLMPLLHFTNLQPLWAHDNLSKGTRLDYKRNPEDSP